VSGVEPYRDGVSHSCPLPGHLGLSTALLTVNIHPVINATATIFIKRRHLGAVKPRGVLPIAPPRRFANYKAPVPSAVALQVIFLSSITRGFLDRPSSPTILARPQLPHSSPLGALITLPLSASYSSTLRSRLPRQQPDSDADRAMEYLALQARQLP
jgi:hypothetical protein